MIHDFEVGTPLGNIVEPRQGLATADNNRFLRQWFEVDINNIKFDAHNIQESILSRKKWFPYNKGGSYRKWYGNYDYVVNWENDGYEIRNFKDISGKVRSRPQNTDYYFREAITWSDVNSGIFSLRLRISGSIYDVKGMSAFAETENDNYYFLGLLNAPLGNYIFKILNPTISLQIGNFQSFPVLMLESNLRNIAVLIAQNNVRISKLEWDKYEISWNFDTHPFINHIAEHTLLKFPNYLSKSLSCGKNVSNLNWEVYYG